MRLIEGVVTTMVRVLQDGMDAKLTAIEEELNDGILLDRPRAILDYQPAREEQPGMPCVYVLAGTSIFPIDTGFGAGGYVDAQHSVTVVAMIEDADPRKLSQRILRWQRALIEVLGAQRYGLLDATGQSSWHGLSIVSTTPGERFQEGTQPGAYGSFTSVTVRVNRQEV